MTRGIPDRRHAVFLLRITGIAPWPWKWGQIKYNLFDRTHHIAYVSGTVIGWVLIELRNKNAAGMAASMSPAPIAPRKGEAVGLAQVLGRQIASAEGVESEATSAVRLRATRLPGLRPGPTDRRFFQPRALASP